MQEKMADVLGISKTHIIPNVVLALLWGSGTVMVSISIFLRILRSTNDGFLILILDNFVFVAGISILALPCIFFVKELIHDLRVNFVLSKTLISQDGICTQLKNDLKYTWGDIEAINGYYERWRGNYVVILFSDGRSIEIPIVHKGKEKTTNFLKEVCRKASNETKINKLAEKLLKTG